MALNNSVLIQLLKLSAPAKPHPGQHPQIPLAVIVITPAVIHRQWLDLLEGEFFREVAKAVMFIETQQLQPVAVGQVGVALDDQVILVVAAARRGAQVMAAAEDGRGVAGEVGDDGFGVHQQVALRPFMFSRSQPSRPVLSSAVAANSAVRSA